MAKKTYKTGRYTPRHPEKYVGDPANIIFRSSWELELNKFFDYNPNIKRWSSEQIAIPYIKPTTGRVHRYFPDYWVEYVDRDNNTIQEIIEVKPMNQVSLANKKRLSEYEKVTYAINVAKWKSAQQFCEKQGIKFTILTEEQLFTR